MALLIVGIENSKFVVHNNVDIVSFSNTMVEGNGWKCSIDNMGNIYCVATKYYEGVMHQIKLTLKNGVARTVLKIGNRNIKVLKKDKLEKWPIDGTIELPGGPIDNRKPCFTEFSLLEFFYEHGITEIKGKSPNWKYQLLQIYEGEALIFDEKLETDGNTKLESSVLKNDKKLKQKGITINQEVAVTDATWVVKTIWEYGVIKKRILYTLENPRKIEGLPYFE